MQEIEDCRLLGNRAADGRIRTLPGRRWKPDLWAILIVQGGDMLTVLADAGFVDAEAAEQRPLSAEPGVELDHPFVGLLGEEGWLETPHYCVVSSSITGAKPGA